MAFYVSVRDPVDLWISEHIRAPLVPYLWDGDFHGSRKEPVYWAREYIPTTIIGRNNSFMFPGLLEAVASETQTLRHSVPRQWGTPRECYKFFLFFFLFFFYFCALSEEVRTIILQNKRSCCTNNVTLSLESTRCVLLFYRIKEVAVQTTSLCPWSPPYRKLHKKEIW